MSCCPHCGEVLGCYWGKAAKQHTQRCSVASPADRLYYKRTQKWNTAGKKLPQWVFKELAARECASQDDTSPLVPPAVFK